MKTKILFFSIFLTFFSISFSQNNQLFTMSKDFYQNVNYLNYSNKQVIDRIASSYNISAQSIKITYKFTLNQKIVLNNPKQLKIDVRLKNLVLPEIFYNGFILEKNNLPTKMKYGLVLLKNAQAIKTYQVQTNLSEGSFFSEIFVDTAFSQNQKYTLNISDIQIEYDNTEVSNFNSWANLVDNYMQASQKGNEFYTQIHSIPNNPTALSITQNLDDVYTYDDLALKAINFVQNTKQAPFYYTLVNNNKDPKQLANNLNNIFQESSTLHGACDNVINQMDIIYYDRGNIDYRRKNYQNALFNFNKSVEKNQNFAPAHYMIAEISYNMGNYNDAETTLKNILLNIRGDNNTIAQSVNLAKQLYNTYLTLAEKNITANNYDDAVEWLYHAQDFCNSLYELNCDDRLTNDFISVYESKMNFLLQNVDNSVKNLLMQDAESFLIQAMNFRKGHLEYLQDEKPLIDRSMNIYQTYINLGDDARKNKKYDIATNDYNFAKNFCSTNQYVNCPGDIDGLITNVKYDQYNDYIVDAETQYNYGKNDEAEKAITLAQNFQVNNGLEVSSRYNQVLLKIMQKKYNDLIANGLVLVKKYDYQNALSNFTNAQNVENSYAIKKNFNLSSYISSTAQKLVLQKIDIAEENVKQNNLDLARTNTQEARDIATQYNLMNIKQVSTAFDDINSKIFSQECVNYKNEFNDLYNQAWDKANSKNYQEADKLLQDAKNVAVTNPNCYINTSDVDKKINEIKDVVDYLNLFDKAKSNYNQRDYSSSINNIINANNIFENKRIESRFGIKGLTLNQFILDKSNDFILYASGYYLSKNNLDESLAMLKELKNKGQKNKMSKDIQTQLGSKLAVRDHETMSSSNPKSIVLKYTFNDKWFKYLSTSYLKIWKGL